MDITHRLNHLANHIAPLNGYTLGVSGQLIGLSGIVRILFNRTRELFHAGCGLFKTTRLLLCTAGKILIAGSNFFSGDVDRLCRTFNR